MPHSKDFLFDKRILERNVATGLIKKAELDKHMKGLADLAGKSDMTAVPLVRVEARPAGPKKPAPLPPVVPVLEDDEE